MIVSTPNASLMQHISSYDGLEHTHIPPVPHQHMILRISQGRHPEDCFQVICDMFKNPAAPPALVFLNSLVILELIHLHFDIHLCGSPPVFFSTLLKFLCWISHTHTASPSSAPTHTRLLSMGAIPKDPVIDLLLFSCVLILGNFISGHSFHLSPLH